ncbi:Inactive FRIGIDA-like protein 2 [Citrus sinensis]|uniref:inactive FRIGIDA-like protein 2 n=1 Tax=Citrus sinensis TaxID=2711 RepID=UPI002198F9FE|nr:inactive FRIGIDA-like protein 2 [Citrus sinensis]KAH9688461.1 Inactive FRIGIDA-like protein 2 [Citrus sinensis]
MLSSPLPSFDQILESTQKPKLRKAFKLLKSHACKVANFTLQWQDLEDHLRFIHSEIESKIQQNSAAKTIQSDTNPPSKDSILPQNNNPENKASKTSEISVKNGKELILYVKEHVRDHGLLQDYLFKLFKAVDEPGKLVLEALREFYSLADTETRSSCVVVLEEFGRVKEEVDDVAEEVREEAKRFAVEWRGKLGMKNSLEVLGFLLLLIDFELVGEFGFDEILKLFNCVSSRKQAPGLFRALGFADKAADYIQELIAKNRRLEAIRFIYEFELVDQFPPVPLLKGHAKYAKKVAKEIRKKGKNSFEAQNDATKSEIAALRGIIRFIENYQLGSEYSPNMLRNQIQQIKKQRKERKADTKTTGSKANTKITGSNAESQQSNGNKRTAPASKAEQNQPKRIRREPAADMSAFAKTLPPIHLKQATHHQPISSFEGQGTQNSAPLARTEAPSQAVPYTYADATSNAQAARLLSHLSTAAPHLNSPPMYAKQTTHHQPISSFVGQGTQNSTHLARTVAPSQAGPGTFAGATSSAHIQQSPDQAALLLSHLSTIVQHLTSPFGNYNRAGSTPINSSYTSLSARPYELSGAATIHPHMSSSPGPYGRSIPANGSPGQFGFGATHTPIASALGDLLRTSMYYNNWQASSPSTGIAPNSSFHASRYYDRPAPSGGNYGISSKSQPSIYHP